MSDEKRSIIINLIIILERYLLTAEKQQGYVKLCETHSIALLERYRLLSEIFNDTI